MYNTRKILNKISKKLYELLLPFSCILCNNLSDRKQDLCSYCFKHLPFYPQGCKRCGQTITTADTSLNCGKCLKTPPPYNETIILFHYSAPIRQLITRLKFNHYLISARVLGELLTNKIQTNYIKKKLPDIIIPVPLHDQRLKQRGFNQALELARPINRVLKIPIKHSICQRIRNTQAQTTLKATARENNLKNAFTVTHNIKGAHIAIVEDVITTGSTLASLCKTLQQAGATQIDVWCIARGCLDIVEKGR